MFARIHLPHAVIFSSSHELDTNLESSGQKEHELRIFLYSLRLARDHVSGVVLLNVT